MHKIIPPSAVLIPEHADQVFSGVLFDVFQWQQLLFDGSYACFEMLRRIDSVCIIAVIDDKLMVLDETQPNMQPFVTFPGGRVDPEDHTPLRAAQRELKEETGYELSDWKLLSVKQPSEKMEYFVYTYLAYGSYTQATVKHDAGERISVRLEPYEAVRQMAAGDTGRLQKGNGWFKCAETLQALLCLPEYEGKEVER